ncbi:MAG: acyltransferase domain-containing protein [Victivallaceae bacterium]|nr:acyltransferase domain-containing protein [Victivallaceae bacterium]
MHWIDRLPGFESAEKSARAGGIPQEALGNLESLHRRIAASDTLSALTVECCNRLACKQGNADAGKNFFSPVELERFRVLTLLLSFDAARENFRRAGYPEDFFYATWSDFGHWAKHYLDGIGDLRFPANVFNWYQLHIAGELLQLGRLQFQTPDFYRGEADLTPYLVPGDPIVGFHIFEGAPLDFDACVASFRRLTQMMKQYRPEHDYRALVSHSWLYDPALTEILSPGSNIMRFRTLGKIVPTDEPADTLWRVFGENDPGTVKNPNSLQKKILAFLERGGRFHYGYLVIPRAEADAL